MRPSVPLQQRLYLRPLPHQQGSLEAGSTSGALLMDTRLEGDLTCPCRLELFYFRPYVARPHIFVHTTDGRFNVDTLHRGSSTSAADRLHAFRQPQEAPSGNRRMSIRKNEVLMGAVVILVGILLISFVVFRPNKTQTVIGAPEIPSQLSEISEPQLLAGDALIALAVQPGHYPPQLVVGDAVRIAVTPGVDGNSETRLLPDEAVVTSISTSNDIQTESVITVIAPQTVLASIAASGELHVAKVNGAQQ